MADTDRLRGKIPILPGCHNMPTAMGVRANPRTSIDQRRSQMTEITVPSQEQDDLAGAAARLDSTMDVSGVGEREGLRNGRHQLSSRSQVDDALESEEAFAGRAHHGQVRTGDLLHHVIVDTEVLMDGEITKADNRFPRDLGSTLPSFRGEPVGCFADDSQFVDDAGIDDGIRDPIDTRNRQVNGGDDVS
nr:hypothetical protein [Actinomyces viscosus]